MSETKEATTGEWIALVGLDERISRLSLQAAEVVGCEAEPVQLTGLEELLQRRTLPLVVVIGQDVDLDGISTALTSLQHPSQILLVGGDLESAVALVSEGGGKADVDLLPPGASESTFRFKFSHTVALARQLRRASGSREEVHELERDLLQLRDKTINLYEQRERMNAVTRLSHHISALDLDRILDVCIREVPRIVGASQASVYLYDYANRQLVLMRHSQDRKLNDRIRLEDNPYSPMGHALDVNQIVIVDDFDQYEEKHNVRFERSYRTRYDTKTSVIVPLRSGERIVGVLNLTGKTGGGTFRVGDDLPPIEQLSAIIGASIRNCQLFEEVQKQARSDGMTGFLNHNTFYEDLTREIRRTKRYGDPLSLIIMDVDDFKTFNDAHGHQAGDFILRETARLIRENIRDVDIPARYGGDEFAIVLPRIDLDGAMLAASRIRQHLGAHPFTYQDVEFRITVSSGIGTHHEEESSADLVRKTDAAMYRAKAKGKNRTEVAE
jgi:diguanylate cyclase (GGDEF)-like protein